MAMAKIYFLMAFVCGVLAYFSTYNKPAILDSNGALQKKRQRILFYLILIVVLVGFSGFRRIAAQGMDEYAYRARFDMFVGFSWREAISYTPNEPLIAILCYISTRLFDTNQGFLILSSIVVLLPIITSFAKYSIDFAYAIILLFATGQLYSTFNGIAQFVSAAIFLFAIPYIYKRQFWKYLFVVIICCLFHTAAIVLIPIYFIALNRTDSIKGIVTSLITLVFIIIAYNSLETIISVTGMFDDYTGLLEQGHHGVNIVTIAINCVPAGLALVTGKFTKDDKVTTMFGNMCVLHALIYIASIMDVYIARFAIYTYTFVALYLSRVTKVFSNESKIIFRIGSVVLYAVVCYMKINQSRYFFNFTL